MPLSSNLSNEEMCLEAGMPPESQTDSLSMKNHNHMTSFSNDFMLKDAEHSLTICDGSRHMKDEKSDTDLSDEDKQENNDGKQDPCPLCNETFSNAAEYTIHLKKHTDGTKCLVCGKILSSANSLDRHLLVHSGEKPFECKHCGKSFTTNGNMNRHKRKRKHLNNTVSESPDKKKRKITNNEEVSSSVNTNKGRLHECSHCVSGFGNAVQTGLTAENFLLISMMDCERRRNCPLNANDPEKTPNLNDGHSKVCKDCGDKCLRMSDLQMDITHKNLFMCKTCDSGFVSQQRFQLHELRHEMTAQNLVINSQIRRDENKKSFMQAIGLFETKKMESLIRNKKSEIKEEYMVEETFPVSNFKPRHCVGDVSSLAESSSIVSLTSKLIRNITSPISADCASPGSNTNQAPASPVEGSVTSKHNVSDNELQCKDCRKCFETKKQLKIHHHQDHLQKNTFRCPQCPYVSTDKSTLTRHIRIHTGERPYMCITCHRKFTTETNAKRHIRKKHNIHEKVKKYVVCNVSEKSNGENTNTKCPYCKKDFGDSKLLTAHKNAPDCPGKPYVCSECPMRFPTKNNCLRHMTHQHKLQKDEAKVAMIIDKQDLKNENEHEGNDEQENSEYISDSVDEVFRKDDVICSQNVQSEHSNIDQNSNVSKNSTENTDNDTYDVNDLIIDDKLQEYSPEENEDTEVSSTHSNVDTVSQRPSSVEVDVSYSMLRLSEETPYQQQEPLDLTIKPIDLRVKCMQNEQNTEKHSSTFTLMHIPPPAHISSFSPNALSSRQSIPNCNLLNFFNQPSFSRSITTKLSLRNFVDTQSDLSRNNSIRKPAEIINQTSEMNLSKTFPLGNSIVESDDSEQELFIAEENTNSSNINGATQSIPSKQYSSDNEINDLASVSSVIDTANSQDISKFLNPSTFTQAHSSKSGFTISGNATKTVCRNSSDTSKRFPCDQCNKSFDTSSALKRHMVIHTGVKKHKCSTCGKPFGTKSNCKRHELTHLPKNSQKPCSSFNESQNFSDASNNNLDFTNFSGTVQSENFDHHSDMSLHALSHSLDASTLNPASSISATFSHLLSQDFSCIQNLECKYCLNTYKGKKDLSNHMKDLHPVEYMRETCKMSS